jgi:hypothetical protein
MIPCSDRRCTHVDENGVRCITRLCFANPGPDCFIHQRALVMPSREVQERMALEHLDRLMQAQPTPAYERVAADASVLEAVP